MSCDGSRIGRSQITDSRVRNIATCTGDGEALLWRENLVRATVFPQGDQRRFTSPLDHTGRNLPGVRPVPCGGSAATSRPIRPAVASVAVIYSQWPLRVGPSG
jgi:hypothetical protein